MRRWTIFIATTFVVLLTTIGTAFAQTQSDGIDPVAGTGGVAGAGGEGYVGGTAATGSDVSMTMVAIAILVVADSPVSTAWRRGPRVDADPERAQPISRRPAPRSAHDR